MFLLSNRLLRLYMKKGLVIENFDENHLAGSAYYFRLGKRADLVLETGEQAIKLERQNDSLDLPPRSLVRVESLERFTLPPNVFVLIGNHTSLPVEKGVLLLNGASIDPGYVGRLELLLVNLGYETLTLHVGDRLGKLLFFDVSDTGLEEAAMTRSALERSTRLDSR